MHDLVKRLKTSHDYPPPPPPPTQAEALPLSNFQCETCLNKNPIFYDENQKLDILMKAQKCNKSCDRICLDCCNAVNCTPNQQIEHMIRLLNKIKTDKTFKIDPNNKELINCENLIQSILDNYNYN